MPLLKTTLPTTAYTHHRHLVCFLSSSAHLLSLSRPRPQQRAHAEQEHHTLTAPHTVIWTYTRDQVQNLCGDSSFVRTGGHGPPLPACQTFARYDTDGYWLVTGFSGDGSSWKRFASVQSCVIAIRRTDGRAGLVP